MKLSEGTTEIESLRSNSWGLLGFDFKFPRRKVVDLSYYDVAADDGDGEDGDGDEDRSDSKLKCSSYGYVGDSDDDCGSDACVEKKRKRKKNKPLTMFSTRLIVILKFHHR